MTANVSGINPNLTFLATFTILARYGDYRGATLYRILTDDLKFCTDYQTNQHLADRLGVTRNKLVVTLDKLIDYGVVLPTQKAGPVRSIVIAPIPTPRFVMWSLQTLVPDFEAVRSQINAPVGDFVFTSYGYDHQETPLHREFSEAWARFVARVIPPSISPEPGYVVAAAEDTSEGAARVFQLLQRGVPISSCSCSILTTKTTTTTTTDAQVTVDAVLPAVATPGEPPVFRKTARTVSRRKTANTLAPVKNSWACRFRSMADLQLIEPERYAEIEMLVTLYNKVFGKALVFNPYSYASTREALIEGKVPSGQIKHAFEVAARDPFWSKQAYTTLLKPDRISSFVTTRHDRYARNQTQQPDATTETREF